MATRTANGGKKGVSAVPPPGQGLDRIVSRSEGGSALEQRVASLLESPASVAELSPLELHRLVLQGDLTRLGGLLELAKPEQVRDVVDLQIWHRDRVDLPSLEAWLLALSRLSGSAFRRHLQALDIELVGLFFRRCSNIYLVQEDEVPDEARGVFYQTPDNVFVVDLIGTSEGQIAHLVEIIEAFYRSDPDEARRLLQNVMWDLPTELEEWSYRWRTRRLEDLGFVDATAASEVYAFVDPTAVRPGEGTSDRPLRADPEPTLGADLETILPADRSSFWTRSIDQVQSPVERQRLARALLYLSNMTLSADRVDPADTEQARESLDHLRGRLSLGLEHLTGGQVSAAPPVLHEVALMRLGRLGYSLVVERQRRLLPLLRAGRLGRHPGQVDLVDSRTRGCLKAILAERPLLVRQDGGSRPFASLADLVAADQLVDEVLTIAELVPPSSWPDPLPVGATLAAIFATDLANTLLSRSGPLDRPALGALKGRIGEGGLFDPLVLREAHRLAERRLERPLDECTRTVVERWIDQVASTLAPLAEDALDPRFIEGLILQQGE